MGTSSPRQRCSRHLRATLGTSALEYRAAPVKGLKRHLARFCDVVNADEFRTSLLCSKCDKRLGEK